MAYFIIQVETKRFDTTANNQMFEFCYAMGYGHVYFVVVVFVKNQDKTTINKH
jgi:hypothetical protein